MRGGSFDHACCLYRSTTQVKNVQCEPGRTASEALSKPKREYDRKIATQAAQLADDKHIYIPAGEHVPKLLNAPSDSYPILQQDDPRAAKADSCEKIVQSWPKRAVTCRPYNTGSVLPLDILLKILKILCDEIDSSGVRSASVIARDICNFSQVSKELWTASQIALHELSSLCPEPRLALKYFKPWCKNDASWDDFLREPLSTDADRVFEIALQCLTWFALYEDRTMCIVATFNKLHLTKPSYVPFRLLWAVFQERSCPDMDFPYTPSPFWPVRTWSTDGRLQYDAALFSDLKMRRLLIQRGIQTLQNFYGIVSCEKSKMQLVTDLLMLSDKEYLEKLRKCGLSDTEYFEKVSCMPCLCGAWYPWPGQGSVKCSIG